MEKLGIQGPLLLTQIINFSILLLILSKFLYKPILKNLKDRKQKIEDGLAWSEKAKQAEEKLEKKKQEILKDTRDEAKVILENARKDASRLKEEIITQGKAEVAALKVKLEKELQAEQQKLADELTAHTVDIASEMVKQVLPDVLSKENQHQIIKAQLKKIQARHEK